jgi:hypothetical protein
MAGRIGAKMTFLGYTFATLLLLVLGALWRGYVLCLLWAWFMVPTFKAPELSIPAAIGVALVVSYLCRDGKPSEKDKTFAQQLATGAVTVALSPLIALGIGAMVRGFM